MANPLRSRRGGVLVFGLLALLTLGLGGFGVTRFSGSTQTVASVGDRAIKINDYARALQREIRAFSAEQGVPVNMEMAQALGIDRRVQGQLFAAAALDNEAARLGLSVGNAEVGKRILAIQAFQGPDGTFSRDTYSLTLKQEGMSEAEFEDKLRDEAARGLLQGAVAGGIDAPATFVRTLADYIGETRSFTVAELLPSDLTEAVPAPTDAEIDAQYKATPDAYTQAETRRLTTVWLSPEMIADTIEVDEQALKDAYQARIGEFVIPEKRLVERLVFGTEDEARAAKARIDTGAVTLADLAVERGLEAKDIDLGEVSKDDLGAAGDGVFALTSTGCRRPASEQPRPGALCHERHPSGGRDAVRGGPRRSGPRSPAGPRAPPHRRRQRQHRRPSGQRGQSGRCGEGNRHGGWHPWIHQGQRRRSGGL